MYFLCFKIWICLIKSDVLAIQYMTPKNRALLPFIEYRCMYCVMDQSVGGQLGWILPKEAVPSSRLIAPADMQYSAVG